MIRGRGWPNTRSWERGIVPFEQIRPRHASRVDVWDVLDHVLEEKRRNRSIQREAARVGGFGKPPLAAPREAPRGDLHAAPVGGALDTDAPEVSA